jgi:predicted dehydrogenase
LRESETERVETVTADRDEAYRREHQAFMDCLDGHREPESAGPAAARSVELFAMAMTLLAEGRRVACQWRGFE